MSVLQEQIGGLATETEDGVLKPKTFKYVLEQDYLKELLQQIRGQQASITLLLQTCQSESLAKLEQSMQDYNIVLQHMAGKGLLLWRGLHSSGQYQLQVPTAIVGNHETESVLELSSFITDTRFDFDDQVINSKAYRRALGNLRHAQIDPSRLTINENPLEPSLQQLHDAQSDHLDDEEAASPNIHPPLTSFDISDVLEDNSRTTGIESLPATQHLDESASTQFKGKGIADDMTTAVSTIPVRRRPVPIREKSADLNIARSRDAGGGIDSKTADSEEKALSWESEDGVKTEEMSMVDDQSLARPQHTAASTTPEISCPPSPAALRPTGTNNSEGFPLEAVLVKQQSDKDPKDSVASSKQAELLSPQSLAVEPPDSTNEQVATPSPNRPLSRFQQFMSALTQPSSAEIVVIKRKLVVVGDGFNGEKTCLLYKFSKAILPDSFQGYIPTGL